MNCEKVIVVKSCKKTKTRLMEASKSLSIYICIVLFESDKSMSKESFNFALREIRLMEKGAFWSGGFDLAFGF
jgi:hypothetical protein